MNWTGQSLCWVLDKTNDELIAAFQEKDTGNYILLTKGGQVFEVKAWNKFHVHKLSFIE